MKVIKKSIISGKFNSMELNVTKEQLDLHSQGKLVQEVFPQLNREEREFLISGITPKEWNQHFNNLD